MRKFNKIFGIGFPRTGTCSLAAALYSLGVECVHYPTDEELLKEYPAACDITVTFRYKQLDEAFPGSLFILTKRDVMKNFHKSMCKIFPNFHNFPDKLFVKEHTQDGLEQAQQAHMDEVREYFKGKDQLLELNLVETARTVSMDKLMTFLEVPYEGQEMPHLNDTFVANRVQNLLIRPDGFVKHLRVAQPGDRGRREQQQMRRMQRQQPTDSKPQVPLREETLTFEVDPANPSVLTMKGLPA